MNKLKTLLMAPPVLRPLNYDIAKEIQSPPRSSDDRLVIAVIDSSIHGSGRVLYQANVLDRHLILFRSCTFNSAESRYSQPKLELYSVFQAVKELQHQIWGVHFALEVNTKFLEQMILPNVPMT